MFVPKRSNKAKKQQQFRKLNPTKRHKITTTSTTKQLPTSIPTTTTLPITTTITNKPPKTKRTIDCQQNNLTSVSSQLTTTRSLSQLSLVNDVNCSEQRADNNTRLVIELESLLDTHKLHKAMLDVSNVDTHHIDIRHMSKEQPNHLPSSSTSFLNDNYNNNNHYHQNSAMFLSVCQTPNVFRSTKPSFAEKQVTRYVLFVWFLVFYWSCFFETNLYNYASQKCIQWYNLVYNWYLQNLFFFLSPK